MNSQNKKRTIPGGVNTEIEVNLRLSLPGDRAAFENMLAGEKWRDLVLDFHCTIIHWRDTTQNPAQAEAFKSVCNCLREEMAVAGLTFANPEFVKQERLERRKRRADAVI